MEDMIADGAKSAFTAGENLFRLLRFARETQCGEEVAKPVLDELEVMRLCRSFGMMSSVNPKDFEFSVLHAREFDEDFSRFLRYELLENSCLGDMKLKGVFGKQNQISDALLDMNACSTEMLLTLADANDGIYCVKLNFEQSLKHQRDGKDVIDLLLFCWIRDELFQPQKLRDIPTYVLRFLTKLTPDIICCTTPYDLDQIVAAMAIPNEQADDELSSYSVSFRIEKQENQPDSTSCVAISSVDLKKLSEDCIDICLLKGSYPAIAVSKLVKSVVRTKPFNQTFRSEAKLKFAEWLIAESRHFRIDLNRGIVRSRKLCENVLKAFDIWPEDEIRAFREAQNVKEQQEYDLAATRFKEEIAERRANLERVADHLFRLCVGDTASASLNCESFQVALSDYEVFRKWIRCTCHRPMDKKIVATLDAPINLETVKATLYALFSNGEDDELIKMIRMCAGTPHSEIMKAINKRKTKKLNVIVPDEKVTKSELFLEKVSGALKELQVKWRIAVESVFAVVKDVKLSDLKSKTTKASGGFENVIIERKLDQLREMLLSRDGLLLSLSACTRGRGTVICKGIKEVVVPSSVSQNIVKLAMQGGNLVSASWGQECLGWHQMLPDEKLVATFTIKVRSALLVCSREGSMFVKTLDFSPSTASRNQRQVSEKIVRAFGQIPSLCDYDARNRIISFVLKDSVGIYKFDETFKGMEVVKIVDLGVRSTLAELPFKDVLLMDSTVYVTDTSGYSQGINLHNDRTSQVMSVHDEAKTRVSRSQLLDLADKLALGVISCAQSDDGAFKGILECISQDDYRQLPLLPLGVSFLTNQVSVQSVDDCVLVLDPIAQIVYSFSIRVTVRSNSYRMRQSGKNNSVLESGATSSDRPRKQHWMYTFYHVFEKFPVHGMLETENLPPVSIVIACPGLKEINTALESYHDFLSLLMSDLMALNKPLHGLDLTRGLTLQRSLDDVSMSLVPLNLFFQTVITFLPVQICRAEGNALTVLYDGMDQSFETEDDTQPWEATDIAESIRFGLLSPLLCAWRGRCVVITSMGKQSTGKSYFLNHVTGSSFAIAGNRCTDGAWMTLRILKDCLLVVLDFEGLGSFERTDQEDVFLSVLNASLSMFTIFRMEMRFDKDIDGLFTRFQKGVSLLKKEKKLFQGTLYMSVKDVNPNDQDGVLSEFKQKFQRLLTANCENFFLSEMYTGELQINCSPPLGTSGYYESLRHARQLVTKLVNESDLSRGYDSGNSFHDCIRLVLAKISILDWTAVDESSQRLQMNELKRKIPGIIRTGCYIPVEAQATHEHLPRSLKDLPFHDTSVLRSLNFEQLSQDFPESSQSWAKVDVEVSLDGIEDENVDFGPAVCFFENVGTSCINLTLLKLFQRYMALISKGPLEKIVHEDYVNFDAMLSFLVCRRVIKTMLWVKQFLGTERFMTEWEQIEQTYIFPFQALVKRCLHHCAKCQLQCMRSVCHSFDDDHDCGMDHVCRSLCEYCALSCRLGEKELPRCVGKAGHEGKCDCVKGDHTCGKECSLIGASNCGGLCVLRGGHEGDHRCSVKQHACGAACSASECHGTCILNMAHRHTVHKCAETQCKHACEMIGCKERCSHASHFHDQPELKAKFAEENGQMHERVTMSQQTLHLCSSRHNCGATCQMKGICTKSVQISTSKFSGSRDTFDFELKQMVGIRNKCAVVLQPGITNHDNVAHSCVRLLPNGTETVHGCDVRCEACEYYCDKSIGHEGDHSAAHGNMRNMHFVADDVDVINWENRKYVPGEKGVAEMCNIHCSSAGRGHVHYLKCDKKSSSACVYAGLQDKRRHCASNLKPITKHEVDELLHEKYWKTIGWEDPCASAFERAHFAKCPYLCDAPEHKGDDKSPSYCDLEAWHRPVAGPSSSEQKGISYISGHRFACSHVSTTGKLHHVFVLDCSGSMRGEPWQDLVSAVHGYLQSRLSAGITQDIVSVVTFGNRGIVEFESISIGSALRRRIEYHGGGTFYSNGLNEANAIFSRSDLEAYKPVMIFFTDGRPADRKKGPALAVDVRNRYAKFGLRTFVVGFGRASDMGLSDLAEKLSGSVYEALTSVDLGEAFRSISMSLGARAGLIHSTTAA